MEKIITQIGNPVLRRKSKIVKNIDSKEIEDLIALMTKTMRAADLIGIAAPQVGLNLRIFIIEIRPTALRKNLKDIHKLQVYINPKITSLSKNQTVLYEGCGSVAQSQLFGPVRRPKKVTIEAFDEHGKKFTMTVDGLLAKCIQHEYDHIEGILCIDKFLDTRKIMSREEIIKGTRPL